MNFIKSQDWNNKLKNAQPHENLGLFSENPFSLYVSLIKGDLRPSNFWNSVHFRFKFAIRSLLMPVSTFQILRFLTSSPSGFEIISAQPRIPCRIQRPYLSTAVSRRESIDAIKYHYQLLDDKIKTHGIRKHLSQNGIELCSFHGKDGSEYVVRFISTYRLDKEGESSIIVSTSSGVMLSEITFTFCKRIGLRTVIIGGLQGPNHNGAQAEIKAATKNMYGLFPKRVALESLIFLAEEMGIESILAVSNENHVYNSARYRSRSKLMHSDYNAFWEMSGGEILPDGFYNLPTKILKKNLEEVASKKRSEYRSRYKLIDRLSDYIRSSLECG